MTFGIEFEMNIVDERDIVSSNRVEDGMWMETGWEQEVDVTTALELSSPVYRFITDACNSIKLQFRKLRLKNNIIPYSYNANNHCNENLKMSGQHIHIAPQTYTGDYNLIEKSVFVKHAREIYPLLIAMSAQPLPSIRAYSNLYCKTLIDNRRGLPTGADLPQIINNQNIILEDYMPYSLNNHQQEINYSKHGTVEFRAFDINIPQCSLTEAWILNKICLHSLKPCTKEEYNEFNPVRYADLRAKACNSGYSGLPITELLTTMKEMLMVTDKQGKELEFIDENYSFFVKNEYVGSINNFEVDSVRDMLFLMARYNLSPSDIYHIIKPSKHIYFSKMFNNPDKYIENLAVISPEYKPIFDKWLIESRKVNTFDDLIELSKIMPVLKARGKMGDPFTKKLLKENLKNMIANKEYNISRMMQIAGVPETVIVNRLVNMINNEDENKVNRANEFTLYHNDNNVLVFTVFNPLTGKPVVLGGIDYLLSGEIRNIIVDKQYRRLGIGKILLTTVNRLLNENNVETWGAVRNNNLPAILLFKGVGFKGIEDETYNTIYRKKVTIKNE